jgi:hypothetical protein
MSARLLVTLLTVLSLLVGGLIPLGYMPSGSGDGEMLELVICTADGSRTVYVPADEHGTEDRKGPASDSPGKHDVCAYAGIVLAQIAAPAMILLPSMPVESRAWFAEHQTAAARLDALPPPSRGPPMSGLASADTAMVPELRFLAG